MALAVVAVTPGGLNLALSLQQGVDWELDIYAFHTLDVENRPVYQFKELKALVKDLFLKYDQIVFIMALGIVVRAIAPVVNNKRTDPAVVVMDEEGRNIVSVLSGHLGGANQLAQSLAVFLGGNAVITTATDVRQLPAVDVIAKKLGLELEPFANAKKVSSAFLRNQKVLAFGDRKLAGLAAILEEKGIPVTLVDDLSKIERQNGIYILLTNRVLTDTDWDHTLYLRPRNVTVGIGCRKGVSTNEIKQAVERALAEAERSSLSIKCFNSIDIKSKEVGLLEAANYFGVPVRFWKPQEIEEVFRKGSSLQTSQFVIEKIGVEGVCEPTALLGGKCAKLILHKRKYGRVTVALAEENCG